MALSKGMSHEVAAENAKREEEERQRQAREAKITAIVEQQLRPKLKKEKTVMKRCKVDGIVYPGDLESGLRAIAAKITDSST